MPEAAKNGSQMNTVTLERVKRAFLRSYGPVFLGTLSIEAGCSIKQAELALNHLADIGAIRRLSSQEKRAHDHDERCDVWCVLDKTKLVLVDV